MWRRRENKGGKVAVSETSYNINRAGILLLDSWSLGETINHLWLLDFTPWFRGSLIHFGAVPQSFYSLKELLVYNSFHTWNYLAMQGVISTINCITSDNNTLPNP